MNDRCFQNYEEKQNQIKECIVCRKECKKKDMVSDDYCTEKCVENVSTLKCYYCGNPVATNPDGIQYLVCDEHADDI